MAWYRRGKLVLDGFHTLVSRLSSQNPIFQPSNRILQSGYLNLGNKDASFNGFSSFSSISKRLGKTGFENNKNIRVGSQGGNFNGFSSFSSISKRLGKIGFEINKNIGLGSKGVSFNGFSSFSKNFRRLETRGFEVNKNFRRFYYVDPQNVQHFKPRGPKNWFQNPRHVMIGVVVGSGVFITVYFGNMETVPYTKRTHLTLMPKEMEKTHGEWVFEKRKADFKGKLLPAMHPESVRVRIIANDIVEALKRGLSKENVWSDIDYASENTVFGEEKGKETISALTENGGKVEGNWHREDEILDDKWVQKSRKKGQERGSQPYTSHLDGLNWEILVVNDPMVNAFCFPGGKIVVFTGLLEHFRSDAEIATIIGHEVGHAVARHSAEEMTQSMSVIILYFLLLPFSRSWSPAVLFGMLSAALCFVALLLRLGVRMEIEADYIGLLLVASAGYDPRVAPKVYEKLEKISDFYFYTHRSGRKRAELLAQAQVMDEALTIYKNVREGRGVEGFL